MVITLVLSLGLTLVANEAHPQSGDPTELLVQAQAATQADDDVTALARLNEIRATTTLSEDQKLLFLDLYQAQPDRSDSQAAAALAALNSDDPCLLQAFAARYAGTPEADSVAGQARACLGPFQGTGQDDARPIRRVGPEYPQRAMMDRIEGSCMALFDVTMLGRPRNIAVRCTDDIFFHAMREAIRDWRYEPAEIDGEPVWRRNIQTEMQFSLGG